MTGAEATPWIVIDASHQGELRITHVTPGPVPAVAEIRRYEAAKLLTFTDGLLQYQRDTNLSLRDMRSVLAIAGAATGDNLQIARSRWTISRSGIASILGHPPIVVNEVAAQAWATRRSLPIVTPLRGSGVPNLAATGRYAFVNVGDGVGAALIDIDDRDVARVMESEAGHMDFAPLNEDEAALARACATYRGAASWEQLLLVEPDTVVATLGRDKAAAAQLKAALLGRFTANLILAFGAWGGAMLTGPHVAKIATQGHMSAFDAAFSSRPSFRQLMSRMACWRIEQHEAVIMGSVALIAQHSAMQ